MIGGTAHSTGPERFVPGHIGLLLLVGAACGCGGSVAGPTGDSDPAAAAVSTHGETVPGGEAASDEIETDGTTQPETGAGVDIGSQRDGEIPSMDELVAALDAVPAGLELGIDESLRQPGDPEEWPPTATVGGEPVRIVREFHPSSGKLMRIATARPQVSGSDEAPVLHGVEWRYHERGFPRSVQWWRDDVQHGPVRQWRLVGTIKLEGRFDSGDRDGLWRTYSKNGELVERAIYAKGSLVGPRSTWFPSGQAKESETYREDRLHGHRQVWDRDGILVRDENYRDGELHGRWSDFHPVDGDPREWGTYEDGVKVGTWQRGSVEGNVLSTMEYVDGVPNGLARTWSDDGVLVEELTYVEGERTGPSRTWYADATPQSEGRLEKGRRVGRWTYWKSDGSLNERWSGLYEDDLRVAPLGDDQGGV